MIKKDDLIRLTKFETVNAINTCDDIHILSKFRHIPWPVIDVKKHFHTLWQ